MTATEIPESVRIPMPQPVHVRVPATSANLGPGFDCLGMALDMWSTVTVSLDGTPPAEEDAMAQMALAAARRVYERAGLHAPDSLSARCEGDIPIARGLGASAVARIGGLLAANQMAGRPLDQEQLLLLGTELEGHADNVTPALLGGFQVSVTAGNRVLHASVPLPPQLKAVLFVPELRMPTRESRKLLPDKVSRADAVHNIGRAALLVAALAAGRFDLLDVATDDRLHQPARSRLFPAMYDIFAAARQAGAHCAYLSGGGSTLCALATGGEEPIAEAMHGAAEERGVPGATLITRPAAQGAALVAAG
jgi:homoserine kinase